MGDVNLRPLTAREQRARDFLFRGAVLDVLLIAGAAAQGLLARRLVQAYCSQGGDGLTEGTAGYRYCARVNHGYTWLAACVIAVLLAVFVAKLASRFGHGRRIALFVVFVVVIANTVVVFSLPDLGP